jgi:signal transduction histidine kinase
MTLARRVSLFFLASLALVLLGFSAALYFLVRGQLDRQAEHQLAGTLSALYAAAEIKPDGVEWEPDERLLPAGSGENAARWAVFTPDGRVRSRSTEPLPEGLLPGQGGEPGWKGATRRLNATDVPPHPSSSSSNSGQDDEPRYPFLDFVAGISLAPREAALNWLLGALAGLSLLLWTVAALTGRWVCRRILAPVTHMADSARAIPANATAARLEVAPTHDELEELGQAFNGLLDRLQEAHERQRRFTGEASHQLRTPLAVLLGQIEVALRRERPAEEYRRVLEIAAAQGARLQRIVEMLLFLARADAEAGLPGLERIGPRGWLAQHLTEWANHPRAADIRLTARQEQDCEVSVHPPLLGQVVDILLDNACKYSEPGTPIVLSVRQGDGHAELDVEDRGCGIAEDELPRVFEPFYRSPRLRDRGAGGVGLGLAIARRVAGAMRGQITVESRPGQGSRFTVRLPCPGPELGPATRTQHEGSCSRQ